MKNQDMRVRVTKEIFHRSLMELVQQKPIDRITVKELVEKARVNRGTFYLHYQEPRDVLKEIENDFVAENLSVFETEWSVENNRNVMAKVFAFILENRNICRILMGPNGDPQFLISLGNLAKEGVIAEWQHKNPAYGRRDLEDLFDFVFYGSTQLIINWIEDSKGITVEQLAHRLDRLGNAAVAAVGEF